ACVLFVLLVLWPMHPHRPIRQAVAACYRELAAYAEEIAARAVPGTLMVTAEHPISAWAPPPHAAAVRAALETARRVLGQTRRGRGAETGRGERLLIL